MIPTVPTPSTKQMRFVLPVIRCKANEDLKVVHLSTEWVGINTHYSNGRTVACLGEERCDICKQFVPVWKGYSVVRSFAGDAKALFQFTPNVVDTMQRGFGGERDLAGLIALYKRAGRRKNSPLTCQTFGYTEIERPFTFDMTKELVFRLFKLNNFE